MTHDEKLQLIEKIMPLLTQAPFVIEYLNKVDEKKREALFNQVDFSKLYATYDRFYECFELLLNSLKSGNMDHAPHDILAQYVDKAIFYAKELFFDDRTEEEIIAVDEHHEKALNSVIESINNMIPKKDLSIPQSRSVGSVLSFGSISTLSESGTNASLAASSRSRSSSSSSFDYEDDGHDSADDDNDHGPGM